MSIALLVGALLALAALGFVLYPLFAAGDESPAVPPPPVRAPAPAGDACPVCGAAVTAADRYCSACGARLAHAMP